MKQPNVHFSREEFESRQTRVRKGLEDQALDGLLLFRIEDMYWLTGYDSDGFCIFHNMFIGINGELTHVSRSADLGNVYYSSICTDVREAKDLGGVSWASYIKDMLASHKMQGKRVGIQVDTMGLTAGLFLEIRNTLEGWCELIVCDDFIKRMRLVKSDQELEYHRKAGSIVDGALQDVLSTVQVGAFEGDIYGEFYSTVFRADGDLPAHIPPMGCGSSAVNVRYTTGRKCLEENDQLMLELGCGYRHYHAGSMCVALTGPEFSDLHLEMHKALSVALDEVQANLRPGNTLGMVYDCYKTCITEHNLAHAMQHACGYTMGATWPPTWMEQPLFYSGNETIIEKNMTFFNMLILNDFDSNTIMALGEQTIITDGQPEVITHVPKEPVLIEASPEDQTG